MSKNLFLYVGSSLCTRAKGCVRRHSPAYVARVLETKQNKTKQNKKKKKKKRGKFSVIMVEVWNESHIV